MAAHGPRGAGRRRRARRPGRAVADHQHLRRGPAAHPGAGRVRRDEHRRRRDRPDRRGAADHLRLVAMGAVRQRADRRRGRACRTAGACRDPAPPRPVRPARRGHRHRRDRRPGLRPGQRRHQPDGVSHWGDAKVVASLAAAAVLLAAFAVIETRSPHALLPVRLLRDRTRAGAYLSYAGVGIFIFGMFFFLTLFMQAVWGYSALRTGVAYLPFTAALFIGAGAVAQLVPKIGARPLLLAGSAASTAGLYWLSRISEHDTYTTAVLGPTMVIGAGAALLFVTLSLVALNRVAEADAGVASSLLNTGQQSGGSVGLAVLGTVAWTVVAHSIHAHAAHAAAVAARAGHPPRPGGPLAAAVYSHALGTGFGRGFLVAAGIALLTLAINIAAIRVRRADLAGAQQPVPAVPAESAQPR